MRVRLWVYLLILAALIVLPSCETATSGNEESVKYYRVMDLRYGWKPVGIEPVPPEKLGRDLASVYKFVYRGGELYSVSSIVWGTPCEEVIVWARAVVIEPMRSPYGMGPFVIGPSLDEPRYGCNFPTGDEDLRYRAAIDKKGRITYYEVTRETREGGFLSTFRCTYDKRGRLTRLEAMKNQMPDTFPFISQEWYYDKEEGPAFVEVEQGELETRAILYFKDASGDRTYRGIIAKRTPDGKYHWFRALGEDGPEDEWHVTDELPPEFHKYTKKLPLPPGPSQ